MILWLILAITSLQSILAIVSAAANQEYVAAFKDLRKRTQLKSSRATGVLLLMVAYAIAGLWTWYSVQTGDWRFAAIAWTPSAAKLLLMIVDPKVRA